jgi:hypothetical protein
MQGHHQVRQHLHLRQNHQEAHQEAANRKPLQQREQNHVQVIQTQKVVNQQQAEDLEEGNLIIVESRVISGFYIFVYV